ncbi:unnamed protein product, partial [Didymodactylos carnosus]
VLVCQTYQQKRYNRNRDQIVNQPSSFELNSSGEDVLSIAHEQSAMLPCKAILLIPEPERVMWYKLNSDHYQTAPTTLTVGKHLITKDSRISVFHYTFDPVIPARWDLYISKVKQTDQSLYQCHVILNSISSRSNVRLIVEDITVNIQPSDVIVEAGQSTQFSCNFTGKKRVRRETVTWLKDDQPIIVNQGQIISTSEYPNVTITILKIFSSKPSHTGKYRCTNGHILAKEAKLFVKDSQTNRLFHSLSSATCVLQTRTVQQFLANK